MANVDVLPANGVAAAPIAIGEAAHVVVAAAADALASAALVPAELLDVDMHELARATALVADGLLETDPAEPAHPASVQDRRDGRERHRQQLGDLGRGHPQAAQGD